MPWSVFEQAQVLGGLGTFVAQLRAFKGASQIQQSTHQAHPETSTRRGIITLISLK